MSKGSRRKRLGRFPLKNNPEKAKPTFSNNGCGKPLMNKVFNGKPTAFVRIRYGCYRRVCPIMGRFDLAEERAVFEA